MSSRSRRIEVEIIGDPRSVEAAFGRTLTASMKLQRGLEPINRAAKRTILGLGALAVVTGKMANDFDLTSSRIVGLAGVGEAQVERWKDAMLELAPAVGKAPKELAESLYFIASSGADTADALDILDKSARASAAGLGETQVVADAVTSAMNAYEQSNLSAADATDVLVATVREGKGEAAEIASVIGNSVPIAAELGVSFNEVGAALASMTRLGFDAATASTNLSGVFNALIKPAKDSKDALKEIGTSATEVRDRLEKRGLLDTLQFLSDRFEGNSAALARVFRDVRGFRAVLSLVGKSGEKTAEVFASMEDNTGALSDAFDAIDPQAFEFQQALADLQVTGIELGRTVLPVLSDFAQLISGGASFLGDHAEATRLAAAAIGTLSAVIIAANTGLSIYNSRLLEVVGAGGKLKGALAALPLLGVGAAVIALAVHFSKAASQAERWADSTNRAKDALDRLKDSVLAATQADISRDQAQLRLIEANNRLKDSERVVAQMHDRGKVGTNEYRAAVLGLRQARIDQRRAAADLTIAEGELTEKNREQGTALRNTRTQVEALNTRYRDAVQATKGQLRVLGPVATAEDRRRRSAQLSEGAQRDLARSMGIVARKADDVRAATAKHNPVVAAAAEKVRDEARAVGVLTQKLNHLPTQKQIDVYLSIHSNADAVLEHIDMVRRAAQNRQHGGPVYPGEAYVVGEKRPELLVMGRGGRGFVYPDVPTGGRGTPAASGGGGVRGYAIIDLDSAMVYVRDAAGAEVESARRRAKAKARMGA